MFTLGVVSYLNSLPLYRTLETSGQVRIRRTVPSQLMGPLAAGEYDAALMPVVDYFRGVGAQIVSDACIGSSGPVRSVLMLSNVPVQEVRSVAVDTSSHTSVALLRVILADGYKIKPPFVEHAPDWQAMLSAHDAALIIGDKALEAVPAARREGINIFDLGAAWTAALTKKPFVFAAWFARRGLDETAMQELGALLSAARDEGMRQLKTIVAENPIPTRLEPGQIEDYLRHAVDFKLTAEHRAGLEEFRRRCENHGLLQMQEAQPQLKTP